MLTFDHQTTLRSGTSMKAYRLDPPFQPTDVLQALSKVPGVHFTRGNRDAEHDVGMDSAMDHDVYDSVEEFIASGDFEEYRGDCYTSYYSFRATYQGHELELRFTYAGIIVLCCESEDPDLCAMLKKVKK